MSITSARIDKNETEDGGHVITVYVDHKQAYHEVHYGYGTVREACAALEEVCDRLRRDAS